MKLYAITTSERASKGQGGNDYICIDLLNEKKEKIAEINLMPSSLTIRHYSNDVFLDCVDLSKSVSKSDICAKCGEIHDVEKAGGHDLIQAQKVLECECAEYPDDEFCQEVLKGKKHNYLGCIWCGKSPTRGKYAQYCSEKCEGEAKGKIPMSKDKKGEKQKGENWTCGICKTQFPNERENPRCPKCLTLVD